MSQYLIKNREAVSRRLKDLMMSSYVGDHDTHEWAKEDGVSVLLKSYIRYDSVGIIYLGSP